MAIIKLHDKKYEAILSLACLRAIEKEYNLNNFFELSDKLIKFSSDDFVKLLLLIFKNNNLTINEQEIITSNLSIIDIFNFIKELFMIEDI